MKYVFLTIAIFLLLILQAGLVNQFTVAGSLLIVFSVVTLILSSPREAWFVTILAGLMLDFTSATRDGSMFICMLAVLGGIYIFIHKFVTREPTRLVLVSSVGFGTVIFALTLVVVNKVLVLIHLDSPLDYQFLLGKKLLIDLVANVLFTYPVLFYFGGMKRIEKKFIK